MFPTQPTRLGDASHNDLLRGVMFLGIITLVENIIITGVHLFLVQLPIRYRRYETFHFFSRGSSGYLSLTRALDLE